MGAAEKLDFLDADELYRLTKRKRAKAQVSQLQNMRIPFLLDGDGAPLVLRANVLEKFGQAVAGTVARTKAGPNFGALHQLKQRG